MKKTTGFELNSGKMFNAKVFRNNHNGPNCKPEMSLRGGNFLSWPHTTYAKSRAVGRTQQACSKLILKTKKGNERKLLSHASTLGLI